MAIHDLPDMYALSPRACSPQASGIHIRQIPHGHVTTITYKPMNTWLFPYYLVDHCNNLMSLSFQTHASILDISYVYIHTHLRYRYVVKMVHDD